MRRTTISRSDPLACVIACVVGALSAPAAHAQDSATARPRTHVVATGETLWSLAQQYYGDPLLWPEIYRLNTLVIEDPHWIFPGEELRLVPPDTTMVAPATAAPVASANPATPVTAAAPVTQPPTPVRTVVPVSGADTAQSAQRAMVVPPVVAPAPPPPPTTESASTIFRPTQVSDDASLRAAVDRASYRPVYSGDFYAAGFLTENATLPWGKVLGAAGRATLRNLTSTSSAQLFEEVAVRAPAGADYHVGDSLLVAEFGREVPEWGNVVRPTGILKVTSVNGQDVVGRVVSLFARVTDGAVALPLEHFVDKGSSVPIPIENGTRGSIITVRDLHAITSPQEVVFVNLGRADGIVTGDMFEVLRDPSGAQSPAQQVGVLKVVHVRDHSSSAVVTRVINLGVEPGATVRLIRKMPS